MNNIWVVGSAAVIASVAANLIIRAIAGTGIGHLRRVRAYADASHRVFYCNRHRRRSGGVSLHQTTGQPAREDVPHCRRCGACRVLPTQPVSPLRRDARSVPRPNGFGSCGSDVDAFGRSRNYRRNSAGVVGTPRQQMICGDAERRTTMHQVEVFTCQE